MKRKRNRIAFLCLVTLFAVIKTEKLGETWHFNTRIVGNKILTKEKLLLEGFQEISFSTENNMKLKGLFLERENAKATISFFHGFCPGGKENFTPFVKLAPDYCNLLFVDMSSYGESEGPNFYLNLRNYGKNNYKDIVNAMTFVNKKTDGLPQIIFGWCSGAFHAASALIDLEDKIKGMNIKGLIFDSGFSSLIQISKSPLYHIRHKYTPKLLAPLFGGNKKRAKNSFICKCTSFCLCYFLELVGLFILPAIKEREPESNLYDKIGHLNLPILVIHAEDDKYSPWEKLQKTIEKMPNKELWLIEAGKSSHAENHLKAKHDYKLYMEAWMETLLT